MDDRSESAGPFGDLLRGLRASAGLTQEDLASRAGLTSQAIGLLERGKRTRPHAHTVQRLAEALGLYGAQARAFEAASRGRSAAGTVRVPPWSLPVPPNPLLGQDAVLAQALELLGRPDVRLVTLTGAGGIGKTRLAVEAGRVVGTVPGLRARFDDGVGYAGLAPLRDDRLVASALAAALGVDERPGVPVDETLVDHLNPRRMLLVLDNLEHLPRAAALVATLVGACPGLVVLATSRTPLRVTGEFQLPVPALPTDADAAAVALFRARAEAVDPGFTLGEGDAEAVAELCRRLDGLPFAIELAAARVKLFTPSALLAALDESLAILAGGPEDRTPRQRTLHDTVRWTHDLLGPAEQRAFRRLSVFAGGFTLSGAHEVLGTPGPPTASVEILSSLVDWSLLLVDPGTALAPASSHEPRFRMLETTRQSAVTLLHGCGEEAEATQAHARHLLALAESVQPERLELTEQRWWWTPLEAAHDDLRAGLRRALDHGDVPWCVELASLLWRFWALRHPGEGLTWLQAVYQAGSAAQGTATPAVPRSRWAFLVFVTGLLSARQGEADRAEALYAESLFGYQDLGHARGMSGPLRELAVLALERGDLEDAARRARAAGEAAEKGGTELGRALAVCTLAEALRARGEDQSAREHLAESLSRLQGHRLTGPLVNAQVNTLNRLGVLEADLGRPEAALPLLRRSLGLIWGVVGTAYETVPCLVGLARVAATWGDRERAARLLGAAERVREGLGATLPRTTADARARLVEDLAGVLGPGFDAAYEDGRTRPFTEVIDDAMGGWP